MGRVSPQSTAGRTLAQRGRWTIKDNKSRCGTREWLVPHCAIAGGPQTTSQRPHRKAVVEQGWDHQCSSCPTGTVIALMASIDRSERGVLPACSLDYGKDVLSWLADTLSQLLSAVNIMTLHDWACFLGVALLSMQKVPTVFTAKRKAQPCLYHQEKRRQKKPPVFFTSPIAFLLVLCVITQIPLKYTGK